MFVAAMGNVAMGNGYVYTAVTDKTQPTKNILAFVYLQCLDVYVTASMAMITNLDYKQIRRVISILPPSSYTQIFVSPSMVNCFIYVAAKMQHIYSYHCYRRN